MKVLQIIGLLFILGSASFAQIKIAVVDTEVFEDKKLGIKKLAEAIRELGFLDFTEAFQASDLQFEIRDLEKELANSTIKSKKNLAISKKLQALKIQLAICEAKVAERYKKYESNTIEPIKTQIREKLNVYAKQNGYTMIVGKNTIDSGVLFVDDKIDDITIDFIKFCNEEFEKEKARKIAETPRTAN